MPAIAPSFKPTDWGSFSWDVDMACCTLLFLPSACRALCHGEYPRLTQLIRPFILMEFSLSAAILPEAWVFSWWGRAVYLGCGWSAETDASKKKKKGGKKERKKEKCSALAGPANTPCFSPLLKLATSTGWEICDGKRISLWLFWFPWMVSLWNNSITLTSDPFRNNWSLILIEQGVSSHCH